MVQVGVGVVSDPFFFLNHAANAKQHCIIINKQAMKKNKKPKKFIEFVVGYDFDGPVIHRIEVE